MNLFRSLTTVSLMTFISRILGFCRDLLAAQIFGVNPAVDAFYFAFKIPNFMRNLFAEGAFSQAFVPVLSEYYEQKEHQTKNFISHISGVMWSVLFIITIFGVYKADLLISIFSPGLDQNRYTMAVNMLKITFPYLMLISMTALYGSILNTNKFFLVPSLTPAILNICFIFFALYVSNYFLIPVESQAWAILLAGFLQLFVQIFFVYRKKLWSRPKIQLKDKGVRKVLKLMIPAIFGASLSQISILINTILASFLVTGSITWLYYSERLAYFPLGIFGVALATVSLPHLSSKYNQNLKVDFANTLNWAIRWNLIIAMPATLAMMFLAKLLVITLFFYGKFSLHDVEMTKKSVIAYSFGLPAFMLAKILSTACYATQDVKTPVKFSSISILINIIMSLLLIMPLEHAGLALATTFSSWVNVLLLINFLKKNNLLVSNWRMSWLSFFTKISICCLLPLAIFIYANFYLEHFWLDGNFTKRFFLISLTLIIASFFYILALVATRILQRT